MCAIAKHKDEVVIIFFTLKNHLLSYWWCSFGFAYFFRPVRFSKPDRSLGRFI